MHTDVGHRATGARVNNQFVPLDHRLQNGDMIEVLTSKSHVPSKDWLKFVKSSKAKQRIRAFLKSEEHARSLAIGAEILSRDLRKVKLSLKKVENNGKILALAQEMGLKGEGDLYAEIGYGKIGTAKIISKLLPEESNIEEALQKKPSPLQRIFQRAAKVSRLKVGVKVSGFDDIMVRFAKCCEPLPGDRIVGFITRGRGVTVHYADCPHALEMDPQRMVEVHWDDELKTARKVRLVVYSQDQMGLLANMCKAITENGANISSAHAKTSEVGKAENTFEISIGDAKHYDRVKRGLEMVPGVIKVVRVASVSPNQSNEGEVE